MYNHLEFIENTGTQYIDTGYRPDLDKQISILGTPTIKIQGVKIYDDGKLVYEYKPPETPESRRREERRKAWNEYLDKIDAELELCPFCGGEAEVETHFSTVYERIYGEVTCKKCGTSKRGTKFFDTYDAAYRGIDTEEWVRNAHAEAARSARDEWNRRL